jgi:hypothetical protein
MDGYLGGITLSRYFSGGKLQAGVGYHYLNYQMPENISDVRQQIAEANFYWLAFEDISLSVNYEGTFEQDGVYNRLYVQIRKRF